MQKYKTREKVVFALPMLVCHSAHHIDNLAARRWTLKETSRAYMCPFCCIVFVALNMLVDFHQSIKYYTTNVHC